MKERFVTDLSPDAQVRTTFLVQARERKIARTGSAYLDLDLRDASGVVRAKLWDCDRHALDFEVESVEDLLAAECFEDVVEPYH